ncbi:hypothetical protein [Cytobacillus oceanisediminis]|uniref:Phage-Barnase-EndoU-ColicinE5/D-RelE like nuclease 4 domain-containing protein n=1 Tax=Cytobacillus oceanisediminis 2691 TaxID=1196031 RepID=A0A160MEH5_9BACI|nr:hypothetical protein [Cytobacillus oceanisediminis]AND41490.1 hypothetical protein A361_20765 [Cytobacillus oceanisediminis 2691]
MLDLTGLLSLNSRPNFADVDLPVLREFYYTQLYPYTYEFALSSGERIKLKFDLDRFCHLVAIEKTINPQKRMNFQLVKDYKGMGGWNNIYEGKLNKAFIRSKGVKLNKMKDKMLHFYYLPYLLEHGSLMIKYVPSPGRFINSNFIVFNFHLNDNAFIQLGMKEEWHGKWYYPETFIIERKTPAHPTNPYTNPPSTVVNVTERIKHKRFKSNTKRRRIYSHKGGIRGNNPKR